MYMFRWRRIGSRVGNFFHIGIHCHSVHGFVWTDVGGVIVVVVVVVVGGGGGGSTQCNSGAGRSPSM